MGQGCDQPEIAITCPENNKKCRVGRLTDPSHHKTMQLTTYAIFLLISVIDATGSVWSVAERKAMLKNAARSSELKKETPVEPVRTGQVAALRESLKDRIPVKPKRVVEEELAALRAQVAAKEEALRAARPKREWTKRYTAKELAQFDGRFKEIAEAERKRLEDRARRSRIPAPRTRHHLTPAEARANLREARPKEEPKPIDVDAVLARLQPDRIKANPELARLLLKKEDANYVDAWEAEGDAIRRIDKETIKQDPKVVERLAMWEAERRARLEDLKAIEEKERELIRKNVAEN